MRYIVVGRQGAGKTTVGRILARLLGTKATDTSQVLVDLGRMCRTQGEPVEWDTKRDRPARWWLIRVGCDRTSRDPAFLVRGAFAKGTVCVGARRKEEVLAARHEFAPVKVLLVTGRSGPDASWDLWDLDPQDADATIDNPPGMDEAGLEAQLRRLV